ncbi:MAG: hypothetical protein ABI759_08695 [Candidatus Solibacter sp.]
MPGFGEAPSPENLQFEHAEPIPAEPVGNGPACVVCHRPTGDTYFQAQGQTVCPDCADRIQSGQQAAPASRLVPAAIYGAGAALAGCLLYALVAIVFNLEIGLLAILVGWMVGKAIRHGSKGMGGRPQQILAVLLTYFSISSSYVVVMIHEITTNPSIVEKSKANANPGAAAGQKGEITSAGERPAGGVLLISALTLIAAAPFFGLSQGISGFISLFIIFIGLQRAWQMTGRRQIPVMGPYPVEAAQ